jgi:DNA replication protein DnaC
MSGTEHLVSICEVFEKMRGGVMPDYRTWSGSESERAVYAEAGEYLASVGIDPAGKIYSAADVLSVKRQETACSGCGRKPGDMTACPFRGYKTLLSLDGARVASASGPCAARSAAEKQAEIERLIGELPSKLKTKSFGSFRTDGRTDSVRHALAKAREAAETGESLILAGGVGTGKTHLAAALLTEAIHSGRQGLFRSVPSLMNRLRSFGPKGDYQEVLDAAVRCDVLVLDDLGAERCTDWVGEQLYVVISERYASERQTVVTTNFLTPPELIDHLEPEDKRRDTFAATNYAGQRIVSRLCEMGAWITLLGADQRIKRASKPRKEAA